MAKRRVHIVGGGLAGLSAGLALADAGHPITLYEAGPAAGGRCRSYFDQALGCRIDNGNHLLLSGNHAAMAFLTRLGTRDTLAGPATPCFPFMDLSTGQRWTVRPSAGRIPWWLLSKSRRVPGTSPMDYLVLRKLGQARPRETVASALPAGPLYSRLLEPLAIAALNTPTAVASARLLGAVIDESLSRGGDACIPLFPRDGLSESFIDPAIAALRDTGAALHFSHRISALGLAGDRVTSLAGPAGDIPLGAEEAVIVATPPHIAATLLPDLAVPDEFQSILNLHFKIDCAPTEANFIGLIRSVAEWVFIKPGIVSVTVSAANRLIDRPADDLAQAIWPEVKAALTLSGPIPTYRVVKEKRATFAATPNQQLRRPSATTDWKNCVLAGDYTATGLPATIEGAIRSGLCAAKAVAG